MIKDWQDAVAKAMGAERCSPPERQRAYQYLHNSGLGYRIGGAIADTLRSLVASGEINMEVPDGQPVGE